MAYHSTSNLAVDLGRVDYESAYRLQKHLLELVKQGTSKGFLLFLEHDPVYTVGRKPIRENYIGVEAIETERGGDITYHGPGQQVIYPIVKISDGGNPDVRGFVHFVENTVIGLLSASGYNAHVGEEPGIWITTADGERKVASIGMAIDHGISYHGVSINITSEPLGGFLKIRPCGLDPSVMNYATLGKEKILQSFVGAFSDKYGSFRIMGRDQFLREVSFDL